MQGGAIAALFFLGTLKFGDDHADSSDDAGGGGFVGAQLEQFGREVERVGPQDEAIGLITDVTEDKTVVDVNGIDVWSSGMIGSEGAVVTIENCYGTGAEQGLHGRGQ